jgi:hypothetical protein
MGESENLHFIAYHTGESETESFASSKKCLYAVEFISFAFFTKAFRTRLVEQLLKHTMFDPRGKMKLLQYDSARLISPEQPIRNRLLI